MPIPQSAIAMANWNVMKNGVGHFVPGGSDLMSMAAAADKVTALSDILQEHFQARDEEFNNKDISENDAKQAILYARGKKQSKAIRKGVLAASKITISTVTTATGATVGSIVPVAGTIAGATAGIAAGGVLSQGVTAADRIKRMVKYVAKGKSQGLHRKQAAICLLRMSLQPCGLPEPRNASREAIKVLLGIEADVFLDDRKTFDEQVERLAARMKSN